ncbi:MAG: peptidase C45 [Actinomycetia bacterium]|nr:peptidase C45 [Actinomycetes bacterium]
MSSPIFPIVSVSGDARARGLQHGRQLGEQIRSCVDIYRSAFGLPDAEVELRSAHFEGVTRSWHPELASEIDAIAEGAGQPGYWIWALNARSEIMSYTGAEACECTSVWSPSLSTLAQNWDWMESLEPLTVILDAVHEDGHHLVTVTEPGIVGKVGQSSAGVAVGLNFLYSPESLDGVPVHVLLRALLDARSPDDAELLLATVGSGRSAHVFYGTASGMGSSIEYTGAQTLRADSDTAPLLHTNHFLRTDIDPGTVGPNSRTRHKRASAILDRDGVDDLAAVTALLDDCDGSEFPICRVYAPSAGLPGANVGTVCAIIMRVGDGEMDIRRGPDPAGTWQTVTATQH